MTSDPLFKLELQIQSDKLNQGINGLEWLVLSRNVTPLKIHTLNNWLEFASEFGYEVEAIMKDAVNMDPDSFYRKHELNWWISIDETLTYLSLLRQQNYDKYFNLVRSFFEPS
jgi:hypothetical protein